MCWMSFFTTVSYFCSCITDNPGIEQLRQDTPLEMAYNQYLVYHGRLINGSVSVRVCRRDD